MQVRKYWLRFLRFQRLIMPGPVNLQTHTHSVLFCMCVYCHLAIRLRDSGISQVRYITGLGPVTDYGVLKFCWAK